MARTATHAQTGATAFDRRTIDSPVGALELVAGLRGLRAVLWPGEDGSRVLRAVGTSAPTGDRAAEGGAGEGGAAEGRAAEGRAAGARGAGARGAEGARISSPAAAHLDRAEVQLAQYFAGSRRDFDLDLDPAGTDFQLRVWQALRGIPYGQTVSYGQQAVSMGEPGAARAVGAANGRNPLSIVVPCHRVVSASGSLTGFAGGVQTKAWLLDHERRVLAGG